MIKQLKNILKISLVSLAAIVLVACGGGKDEKEAGGTGSEDTIQITSSFTILTDMIEEIGGDHVEVHNLVPVGTDPHEYEPLPEDIKAATDADLMIYNGLNLEGGESGWFMKLANSVDKPEDQLIEAAADVEPLHLGDGSREEINPHAYLSPKVGEQMAEAILDALKDYAPDNAEDFEKNARQYIDKLAEVDETYRQELTAIPEDDRVLVASEQAFQYMTKEYDVTEGYIWAIDTEENGTPEQIKATVAFVKEHEPRVLFVESNVDLRPMETVSKETGVEIFDQVLFADEVGQAGEEGDTYLGLLEHNLEAIVAGLTGKGE